METIFSYHFVSYNKKVVRTFLLRSPNTVIFWREVTKLHTFHHITCEN